MTFKPHIVQSDDGTEFKNHDTIAWQKENNMKYIFTFPYSTESNGLIENFNIQLGKMFRKFSIRNNNLKRVDIIRKIF